MNATRIVFALVWATGIPVFSPAAEPGTGVSSYDKRPGAHRLVLCNDGGTLAAPDMEAPIGIEGLVKATIDPLRDTMIDTLYWQIGTESNGT